MSYAVFDPKEVQPLEFGPASLNIPDEELRAQVNENIRRGLPQAQPYGPSLETVLLVCGGPSLAYTERELVQAYWRGGKIVTVNATYQWCIDRNLKPSATVMLDAREFNKRFVQTPVPGCQYLLASQCHPQTFEMCRGRNVRIWHAISTGDPEVELLANYYFGPNTNGCTYPITSGTTVALRAISLLRMLGFMRFEIFGLDSCWLGREHHAYPQPENDDEPTIGVWTRPEGRDDLADRFICSPWMAKQAEDFIELIKERGELFQLNVHGPGLIATMIRSGAELVPE